MQNDSFRYPPREVSPYPRYVVTALVPDPLAEPLNTIRRRLDRWSEQWVPPHMTIVPPFNADLTDGQKHQLAAHDFPFEITLGAVGTFRQRRSNVVWYAVEAPDLPERTKALYQAMPWLEPFADRRPPHHHVTVASHIPPHELAYVETAAAAEHIQGTAKIERLSLFLWDANARRWVPAT